MQPFIDGLTHARVRMLSRAGALRGWREELERLARGAYPGFVTSSGNGSEDIGLPVFVFHTIEPKGFEAELRYLTDNGYRSLDADSFLATLRGRRPRQGREVLLTIDDGRSSAWVWAYPLLKRYGHRAVVFVIPGCVPDRAQPLPRLEDDPSAEAPAGDHDPELMSWTELRIGQHDGVFDIQSHTLFHRRVPVSSDVAGFVTPWQREPFYGVPVPLDAEVRSSAALRDLAGLPIFRSEPLLSCQAAYAESPEVLNAPLDLVREHGADSFFRTPGWRRRLLSRVRQARESSGARGRWLEPREMRRAILKELAESKAKIEEQLGSRVVSHLCLPFSAGSRTAVEAAREAGYKSVFWGARYDRALNSEGDDPFYCVRLKHDYIFRLPGVGRRPLGTVLFRKALRRLRGEAIY